MTKKELIADFLLLIVAATWGLTFTVIKNALVDIAPFTFNSLRFLIASLFLAIFVRKKLNLINKKLLFSGVIIGIFLFGGYTFQTIGLKYTTASNSGFITGLAVIFVPIIITIMTRKFPSHYTMAGVTLATIGLYYLSIDKGVALNAGDFLTLLCAICFALHVIAVGELSPKYHTGLLVLIQILTVAIISGFVALFTEPIPKEITQPVLIALFVCAIPATTLAYLIQNWAQKFTTSTKTVIILSMEPVFSAVFAFILLAERMTSRDYLGAALMLIGIVITELKSEDSTKK